MRLSVAERQHLCGSPDAHSADLERAYVAAARSGTSCVHYCAWLTGPSVGRSAS